MDPIKVFIQFDDKDLKVIELIQEHCASLIVNNRIEIWDHRNVALGQITKNERLRNLNEADVILLMISVNLLNSELFYEIEQISIKRAKQNRSILIPVYLKQCYFDGFKFTEFKMLPSDGLPVFKNDLDLNERCYNVAVEIHNIVDTIEGLNRENGRQEKLLLPLTKEDQMNILYIINDPNNMEAEIVNEEINCIKHRLLMGRCSCRYEVIPKNVITLEDLHQALLEVRPRIVHYSGFATPKNKISFKDKNGNEIDFQPEALSTLFSLFNDKLEIVILNTCYSKPQAESISDSINYVIGVDGGVKKEVAIDFVNGFYQAISYGTSIKKAFDLGINLLQLKNLDAANKIMIFENSKSDK